MHTQLQGIESILKVVWIVNHRTKFITRLHSGTIFVIFLDIRLEACSFTKNEPLNRYFSNILTTISPGNCTAAFKNTFFSQNTFNHCFRYTLFSCSMIQKIIRQLIKLEAAYFLHGRCYYSHIYSLLGTL